MTSISDSHPTLRAVKTKNNIAFFCEVYMSRRGLVFGFDMDFKSEKAIAALGRTFSYEEAEIRLKKLGYVVIERSPAKAMGNKDLTDYSLS